jgi:hypothetical protein
VVDHLATPHPAPERFGIPQVSHDSFRTEVGDVLETASLSYKQTEICAQSVEKFGDVAPDEAGRASDKGPHADFSSFSSVIQK